MADEKVYIDDTEHFAKIRKFDEELIKFMKETKKEFEESKKKEEK